MANSDEEMCYDGLKTYQLKVNDHGKCNHLVNTFSHTTTLYALVNR